MNIFIVVRKILRFMVMFCTVYAEEPGLINARRAKAEAKHLDD